MLGYFRTGHLGEVTCFQDCAYRLSQAIQRICRLTSSLRGCMPISAGWGRYLAAAAQRVIIEFDRNLSFT
jgi:hypothetical protein